MAERYHEAVADKELLALREDIALIDARLGDVLGRVDTGESGALWVKARTAFALWQAANKAKDRQQEAMAAFALEAALEEGVADYSAWAEVTDLLERRRKLVESERKRLVDMQQMVTAEQAMILVGALIDTVRRHVTDRATLAAIANDINRLIARRNGEGVDTNGDGGTGDMAGAALGGAGAEAGAVSPSAESSLRQPAAHHSDVSGNAIGKDELGAVVAEARD